MAVIILHISCYDHRSVEKVIISEVIISKVIISKGIKSKVIINKDISIIIVSKVL